MPPADSGAMSKFADQLQQALPPGTVFRHGTDEYGHATSPDNSSYPQHPVVVVRASSSTDVATTVSLARDAGVRVAVQATGHGAGEPIDGGLVLVDTSSLQSVTIDPDTRVAAVGAGAQWAQVQKQAQRHGLLGLAGTSPTVGVAGYTVNGGVGWLVRPHGLASATLRAVEYVDGTGTSRRVDDADPGDDALWAFRGGAPVGIATALEFDVVPVPELWAGYLLWPAEKLPQLAAAWVDQLADAPDGLTSTLALLHVPPKGPFPDDLLGTVVVHLSYASINGEAGLSSMRSAMTAVAKPAVDTTAAADADALAGIHLDPPSATPGRGDGQWLTAVDADQIVAIFTAAGLGSDGGLNMIELRHVAPAASAPTDVDGALTTVPSGFLLHAVGGGPDDGARQATDGVLERVDAAAQPVSTGRTAPGFREGQPDTGSAYPPDVLTRLLQAARRADPSGVFAFQRVAGPDSSEGATR